MGYTVLTVTPHLSGEVELSSCTRLPMFVYMVYIFFNGTSDCVKITLSHNDVAMCKRNLGYVGPFNYMI